VADYVSFVLIFMLIRGKSLRIVLSSWKTIGCYVFVGVTTRKVCYNDLLTLC
jgi:hypothetical protein